MPITQATERQSEVNHTSQRISGKPVESNVISGVMQGDPRNGAGSSTPLTRLSNKPTTLATKKLAH